MLWIGVMAMLAMVVWQDFRCRAVYAWLFPVLAIGVVAHSVVLGVFSVTAVVANLALIAIQLGLLNLLVYWRTRKWLMRGEQWMGWGDIAFFAVSACCFSTVNFVVFYVGSLLIVLFATLAAMAFGKFVRSIPLAGGQALLLVLVMMADYANRGRRLYLDIDMVSFIQ
ncbi:hypothetical protein [Parapedobacter sp. 10938]|uniref:hypothetical protein n=1 Tax=Parapedobacter flavus TaxID=3110225 RepID=UPI002DBFF63E|nr:hypothetical protein [Parapedobacter sp. 10938]